MPPRPARRRRLSSTMPDAAGRPALLAALHASAFDDLPPPWTAAAFAQLLAAPGVTLVLAPDPQPRGFVLARQAGPEAEILTLAVHPDARRRGLGRRLLALLEASLPGAEEIFLEVAETNAAARALYAQSGYREVGRRPRYFRRVTAPDVDALVLRKLLQPAHFI